MTLEEITKKIDDGNDIVVHCDTEEKAIKLLIMCKDRGFTWDDGTEILDNEEDYNGYWYVNREETIYYINIDDKEVFVTFIARAEGESDPYVEYNDIEEGVCVSEYDISFLIDI